MSGGRGAGLVVMDIGDVVVRTAPDAQYARLADLTGLPAASVRAAAEDSGLVLGLESGRIGFPDFVARLCGRLEIPSLPVTVAEEAWNRVLVGLDATVAAAAAALAAQRRLIWATNTSPPHWARIRSWLASAGLTAPACVSYQVGHRKPDSGFFAALADAAPRIGDGAVFIDDRPENVAAAIRHGMTGWLHHDAAATTRRLLDLAIQASAREGTG